jgi:hypothetical protein
MQILEKQAYIFPAGFFIESESKNDTPTRLEIDLQQCFNRSPDILRFISRKKQIEPRRTLPQSIHPYRLNCLSPIFVALSRIIRMQRWTIVHIGVVPSKYPE